MFVEQNMEIHAQGAKHVWHPKFVRTCSSYPLLVCIWHSYTVEFRATSPTEFHFVGANVVCEFPSSYFPHSPQISKTWKKYRFVSELQFACLMPFQNSPSSFVSCFIFFAVVGRTTFACTILNVCFSFSNKLTSGQKLEMFFAPLFIQDACPISFDPSVRHKHDRFALAFSLINHKVLWSLLVLG